MKCIAMNEGRMSGFMKGLMFLLGLLITLKGYAAYDMMTNFSIPSSKSKMPYLATGPNPAKMADQICKTLIYSETDNLGAGGALSFEAKPVYFLSPGQKAGSPQYFYANPNASVEIFNPESGDFSPLIKEGVAPAMSVFESLVCKEAPNLCQDQRTEPLGSSGHFFNDINRRLSAPDSVAHLKKQITSPRDLLNKMYQEKRFIAFGESNHHPLNEAKKELLKFIVEHEEDEKLKVILVEFASDLAEFFKAASQEKVTVDLIKRTVTSPEHYFGPQFPEKFEPNFGLTFYLEFLFPVLQEINLKRPHSPLWVVPIDGRNLKDGNFGAKTSFVKNGTNLSRQKMETVVSYSREREMQTSKNFKEFIQGLKPDEKGVIFYHSAHLIQGFKTNLPYLEKGVWYGDELCDLNWLSMYLKEAEKGKDCGREEIGIVVFDERDKNWAVDGVFVPSSFLSLLAGSKAFAIPMEAFGPEFRGPSLICKSSSICAAGRYVLQSDKEFRKFADALFVARGFTPSFFTLIPPVHLKSNSQIKLP